MNCYSFPLRCFKKVILRLCENSDLIYEIFTLGKRGVTHKSSLSIHPGATKMYHDLKKLFWWSGLKRDVAQFVYACLTCQKSKVEHQKPAGLLTPLDVPEWKWDSISMDFVTSLPNTSRGHDAIWVVVDRLTKSAHFIPINMTYPVAQLAEIYIRDIVKLHGVPSSIVSD